MARKAGSSGGRTAAAVRRAALSLFARQGYAAVSMRQLAGEVDMQASALYNYWPTKQDLLVDLLNQHMSDLLAAWQAERRGGDGKLRHGTIAPDKAPPDCAKSDKARRDRADTGHANPGNDDAGRGGAMPAPSDCASELDAFARFHIRYHLKRPDEVFIAYMELRSLVPEHFKQHEKLRHRYEEYLRDILRRGAIAGVFQIADVKVASMAIIAMLTGVNSWYRRGGRLSRAAIEDIYAQMVLNSVGVSALGSERTRRNTGGRDKVKSRDRGKDKG